MLACLLEEFAAAGPFVADVAGLWLLFGATTAIWYGCAGRVVSTKEAAALVAVGFALVTDMAVLLALNELLPVLGDRHPLEVTPITAAFAVVVIGLGAFLPEGDASRFEPWLARRADLVHLLRVGAAGVVCLVLAVAGPLRLNNGFGSGVSIAAMVCVTALAIWLLGASRLSLGAVEVGIYCCALALLLLTSLRGWAITGHDIQREFAYFDIALSDGHWDVRQYSNPYNACLSITLLPVAVAKLTAVSGVYVFKVIIPVLFAAAPVMIFRTVRNAAPHRVAVLSALFFAMFPTFFTDMPYMGRQEVAFAILGAALLLVTERERERGLRGRRLAFLALMAGLVLSHYSTTYVFLLVLTGAVGTDLCWRILSRLRRRGRGRSASRGSRGRRAAGRGNPGGRGAVREPSFVVWWMVPVVAGLALLWGGPITGTGGQLRSTLTAAIQEVSGLGSGSASSSVSYTVFGGSTETAAQRLKDYETDQAAQNQAAQASGQNLPAAVTDQYQTPLVSAYKLPLTSLGKALDSAGLNTAGANTLIRTVAADLMQVLIPLGFLAVWLRRRHGFEPTRDQVTLAVGGLGMLAALTLVPQFSVDYSVLRGFQQAIFVFAPFMALGLLWTLSWLRRWAVPALCVFTAGLLLDLSGVVPKVTGGYPPQLSLSNSGLYYDIYDPTPPEAAAAVWLEGQIRDSPNPAGTLIQTDFYTYYRLQTILTSRTKATIYPATLNRRSYVLLGTSTVTEGNVTIFYRGDLVTYRYPTPLLDATYDEIFASSGAEIFQ